MEWLWFKGQLGQKDFIIRLLTIWSVGATLYYLGFSILGHRLEDSIFKVLKSAAELLVILLLLPSIVKRLRDINWPVYLAGLFPLTSILDLRIILLLGMSVSPVQSYILIGLSVIALIILLSLVFIKSKDIDADLWR